MKYPSPRMQTNAAWRSFPMRLQYGSPPSDLDPAALALIGRARRSGTDISLDLSVANGRLVIVAGSLLSPPASVNHLAVKLSQADMATLGAGRIDIEIMRNESDPEPRPLLRLIQTNYDGV